MKYLLIVFILIMLGCDGGGNDSQPCDFDFDSFLNGINSQQASSLWSCESDDGQIFIFQAFIDGTGFSTGIGIFTYEQTGCRSADFQGIESSGNIFDIDGSTQSGILIFMLAIDNGNLNSVGCLLQFI